MSDDVYNRILGYVVAGVFAIATSFLLIYTVPTSIVTWIFKRTWKSPWKEANRIFWAGIVYDIDPKTLVTKPTPKNGRNPRIKRIRKKTCYKRYLL